MKECDQAVTSSCVKGTWDDLAGAIEKAYNWLVKWYDKTGLNKSPTVQQEQQLAGMSGISSGQGLELDKAAELYLLEKEE